MTAKLLQVLVVVDVQGAVNAAELEALLPDRRDERLVLSLRNHGNAPLVVRHGAEAQPIDWPGLGRAVEIVARKVREASAGKTLDLYVGGQGPLVVFAHLGHAISKFNGAQSIIARRKAGAPLEVFPLTHAGDAPRRLTARELPEAPSPVSGQVAVYVDVLQRSEPGKYRRAIELTGQQLAGVVELMPKDELTVATDTAAGLAAELDHAFAKLPGLFPHGSLGLFLGGPTSLAFAAGRALNPTVIASVMLYDHDHGAYVPVYELPFEDRSERPLPGDEASVAARAGVKAVLKTAIEALQTEITEADLTALLSARERRQFLKRLAELRPTDSDRRDFSLSLATRTFSFGEGLLEALRNGEPELQARFAKLLLLHELFHDQQGLRSTNYFDIGRAGVVLEMVDFTADVFALRVATTAALRRLAAALPQPAPGAIAAEVTRWLDTVLYGIQAFDLWQQGARIVELADRRLRRYLTWHLQRVRGETVETAEDVAALLDPAVTVELAPVSARLDRLHDRQVIAATPSTELFAAVGGRLIRHAKRSGFDPGDLVEAVRTYNAAGIQGAMRYVLGENRAVLAPWRP